MKRDEASRAAELRRFVADTLSAASREILAAVDRLVAELEEEAAGFRRQVTRQQRQLEVRSVGAKCRRSSSPAEENLENPDLTSPSRSSPPQRRSGRRTSGTRRDPEKKNHIQLRVRVLDDPQTAVLSSSVLKRCPVRELRCRPDLQEADFALLLRTSFPQLAAGDRAFDVLTSDRRRRLRPLELRRLTPGEIHRSAGSSSCRRCTVHIRLKEEPAGVCVQLTGSSVSGPEAGEETCRRPSESVPEVEGSGAGNSSETEMEPSDEVQETSGPAVTSGTENNGTDEGEPSRNRRPEQSEDKPNRRPVGLQLGPAGPVDPGRPAGSNGLDGPAGPLEPPGPPDPAGPPEPPGPGQMDLEEEVSEVSCRLCRSVLGSEAALARHVWSLHTGESVCGVCGEPSASVELLKDHLQDRHRCSGKPLPAVPHSAAAALTGEEDLQEERHRCYICHQEFPLREQLKTHRRTHRNRKSQQCGVCGKSLSDYRSLSRHMMIHSEERPHGCRLCGKRFKLAGTLRQHEKIHTDRRRSHLCHVCCKMFLTGRQLHDHVMTHGEERLHRCSRCGKAFVKKGALTAHMRVHTGETPYRCPHCGWAFRWKNNLAEHLRVHSGVKPYVCGICGKACARKVYLTVHMRTHSGERPYKCSVCQKVFTQGHCLKTHMRSHQGAPAAP